MHHPSSRRAFTLIELLVVLSIVTLLTGMLLATLHDWGRGAQKAKTQVILATVRKGLELTIAAHSGSLSPSEHPLAGSRAGRAPFWGIRGRTLKPDGSVDPASGTLNQNLDTGGEGLGGGPEWYLATDQARALMDDDWYADAGVPLLYGMQRGYLRVLGSQQEAVTRYRRLPIRPNGTALLPPPYDASGYPDQTYLNAPTGAETDNKKSLDYLFGSSGVGSELTRLGALRAPHDNLAINLRRPPAPLPGDNSDGLPIDNGGRVWSDDAGKDRWEPGRFKDSDPLTGKPVWRTYRLRGLAIYDDWGREILCSFSAGSAVRLISAGADGVFRWDPGHNRVLDTDPNASEPAGDDRDGAKDNISQGVSE